MGNSEKGVRKLGRDEMNLAEFPLAVLTDTVPDGVKTLVFEQPDGRMVTVTASDAYGLPTAMDQDVLVGLVSLSKSKNDFADRKLSFNLQELLDTLGLPDDGRAFKRVRESLLRWNGVQLVFDKAWYDNSKKKDGEPRGYRTLAFHVIESVDLRDGRSRGKGEPQSSILWNQTFFESCQANFLKELDLDTYFSFKSAVAKRAYRYLDKRLHGRTAITFDLAEFAFVHVGLSRSYEGNAGKIKEKLRPAIAELEGVGFIRPLPPSERYTKDGKRYWRVHFHKGPLEIASPESPPGPHALVVELEKLGVAGKAAQALFEQHGPDRVARNIAHFQTMSAKKKKGPGWLRRAIEEDYASAGDEAKPQVPVQATLKLVPAELTPAERAKSGAEAWWDGLTPEEQEGARRDALAHATPGKLADYEAINAKLRKAFLNGLAQERTAARLLVEG